MKQEKEGTQRNEPSTTPVELDRKHALRFPNWPTLFSLFSSDKHTPFHRSHCRMPVGPAAALSPAALPAMRARATYVPILIPGSAMHHLSGSRPRGDPTRSHLLISDVW
jgi:hypothetical protein